MADEVLPGADSPLALVIDDDPDIRELLLETLGDESILAEAVGPEEAFGALHRLVPKVVLLDVRMPVLDGYAILRHIRSDPILRSSFVVMLTGVGGAQEVEVALERGADDYIRKPFALEELVARLRRGLKVANAHR
jgi:DNA-binding response OmpR family regulator